MTLNNATRIVEYPGAGSAGPFAVPFKVFDAAHLIVTTTIDATGVSTVVPAEDYTFTGVGLAAGSVTMDAVVPVGTTLKIRRAPPLTQLLSVRNQGPYNAARVEDRFDLLVMQVHGVVDDTDELLAALEERIDAQDVRLDEFDARLDTVEEQIQELIDAQLLEQSAAALPVPILLEAAADDIADASVITRWRSGLLWEIDVSLEADMDPLVTGYPQEFSDPGSELKHILQGLEPATTYYARIRSKRNGLLVSTDSNIISFTTEPLFAATSSADLVTYDEVTDTSRHFFTTTGAHTFEVVEGSRAVRMLLVGAGAMGGGVNGTGVGAGGGGGGGVKEFMEGDLPELGVGVYDLSVGAAATVPAANNVGVNGGDTTFVLGADTLRAKGGGFGGSVGGVKGNGGCGGGAFQNGGTGGLGTTNQGSDGGTSTGSSVMAPAGGGGASRITGDGENGTLAKGGDGGDGYESDISGASVFYGAGGGAARPADAFGVIAATNPGVGGTGGGGNGANATPQQGGAATGIGCGGGGALGNNRGGLGTNGTIVIMHRGMALNVTPVDEEDPPAEPFWRGPITGPGIYDGGIAGDVTVDIAYFVDGVGPTEMHSDDNPVLGQQHTGPGDINSFSDGPPYPGYYACNSLGFKFSHEIRRFRITRKNGTDGTIRHVIFAADTGGEEQYFGDGLAANGGVTNSGTKYLKFFAIGADNRQEVAWVSQDSFKVVIVRQQVPAWGDGSAGYPDAMATVPDTYYDAYFLLTSDPEIAGEDTWEP